MALEHEHDPAAFTEILTITPGSDVNKSIRLSAIVLGPPRMDHTAAVRVLLSVVDIDFRLMESSPTALLCP